MILNKKGNNKIHTILSDCNEAIYLTTASLLAPPTFNDVTNLPAHLRRIIVNPV